MSTTVVDDCPVYTGSGGLVVQDAWLTPLSILNGRCAEENGRFDIGGSSVLLGGILAGSRPSLL